MKWYEIHPERLAMEQMLLHKYHRDCRLFKEKGIIQFFFPVRTSKRSYLLKGIFPNRFPYDPMRVKIVRPDISDHPPHYFEGSGNLCIYGSENYGPETTAKVCIDWSKQWIKHYETWQKTGVWPDTNGR